MPDDLQPWQDALPLGRRNPLALNLPNLNGPLSGAPVPPPAVPNRPLSDIVPDTKLAVIPSGTPPLSALGRTQEYSTLRGMEPQRDDPSLQVSTRRKLLGGILAGIAGTGARSPELATNLYQGVAEGPYQRAHQLWETQVQGVEKESVLADREAQMRQRQRQADLEAAKARQKPKPDLLKVAPGDVVFDPESNQPLYTAPQRTDKPQKFTNPFEAFTYGSAQEKQAAQGFLNYEKQIGQKYEKPGDVEQRYELYNRDPEAYKAMFGDRGAAQGEAQAARMLNYFDKRRKEISGDWALDETEKAKQLSEIDELQKPYMNAAGGNQDSDRVTVIHPNGTKGTIPRSQLKAAQKKGYKTAQ